MCRIERWLSESFWRIMACALILAAMIAVPLIIYGMRVDGARRQWCRDHGYDVAGISKQSGKFRVNEVVCIDDQRRLILPE